MEIEIIRRIVQPTDKGIVELTPEEARVLIQAASGVPITLQERVILEYLQKELACLKY